MYNLVQRTISHVTSYSNTMGSQNVEPDTYVLFILS